MLRRCHAILNRYIVFNLLDSLIVGTANALFMAIVGMPYVGLVSFVVAVINLVPTFGPVIGAIIGGFILLMVNPWHALAFLIFTAILQTIDGYILKPKLFGDSLGVSGPVDTGGRHRGRPGLRRGGHPAGHPRRSHSGLPLRGAFPPLAGGEEKAITIPKARNARRNGEGRFFVWASQSQRGESIQIFLHLLPSIRLAFQVWDE